MPPVVSQPRKRSSKNGSPYERHSKRKRTLLSSVKSVFTSILKPFMGQLDSTEEQEDSYSSSRKSHVRENTEKSLFDAELTPHYLGKTPQMIKVSRAPRSRNHDYGQLHDSMTPKKQLPVSKSSENDHSHTAAHTNGFASEINAAAVTNNLVLPASVAETMIPGKSVDLLHSARRPIPSTSRDLKIREHAVKAPVQKEESKKDVHALEEQFSASTTDIQPFKKQTRKHARASKDESKRKHIRSTAASCHNCCPHCHHRIDQGIDVHALRPVKKQMVDAEVQTVTPFERDEEGSLLMDREISILNPNSSRVFRGSSSTTPRRRGYRTVFTAVDEDLDEIFGNDSEPSPVKESPKPSSTLSSAFNLKKTFAEKPSLPNTGATFEELKQSVPVSKIAQAAKKPEEKQKEVATKEENQKTAPEKVVKFAPTDIKVPPPVQEQTNATSAPETTKTKTKSENVPSVPSFFKVPAPKEVSFAVPEKKQEKETPSFSFASTTTPAPSVATEKRDEKETQPAAAKPFSFFPNTEKKPTSEADSVTSSKTPAFSFGQAASKEPSTQPKPSFSFGGLAKPVQARESKPDEPKESSSQKQDTQKPVFSFGAPLGKPVVPELKKDKAAAESTTPKFSFSTSKPSEQASDKASEPSTASISKPAGGFSFSFGSTKPTDVQNTTAPLVTEKEKPAATGESKPSSTFSAGGFSFGAPKDSSSTSVPSTTPKFNFGVPPSTASKSETAPEGLKKEEPSKAETVKPFTFGIKPTSTPSADVTKPSVTAPSTGFNFGSTGSGFGSLSAGTKDNNATGKTAEQKPAFSFGAVKTEAPTAKPAPVFNFSAPTKPAEASASMTTNNTTAPSAPSFSFGSTNAAAPSTTGFSFGQQSTAGAPAAAPVASGATPAPSFSFGSAAGTSAGFGSQNTAAPAFGSTPFQSAPAPATPFGASNTGFGSAKPATGGFSFSAGTSSAPSMAFNGANNAPAPSMNFGANQAPNPTPSGFTFGASSNSLNTTPSAPGTPSTGAAGTPFQFNMGSTNSQPAPPAGRKIAVPRSRKKR
ncbi:nucleoporin Nup124 [Schizosaccharomyces japonicus yFS275]|uniref:Nucleoporin Nup124 n=1 Tax=Schizosaccharomyces japonicus (strain yFS275 / FY16936) TaxID=402676 RepID=B6K2T1_SCHJY|nr:nucleoporin Nup124 [Schizosaccharomyces japonicus yFS275]EEB08571.1 nucleoporin Nup124 [Schizosaccharomyces japonicus yFS275]